MIATATSPFHKFWRALPRRSTAASALKPYESLQRQRLQPLPSVLQQLMLGRSLIQHRWCVTVLNSRELAMLLRSLTKPDILIDPDESIKQSITAEAMDALWQQLESVHYNPPSTDPVPVPSGDYGDFADGVQLQKFVFKNCRSPCFMPMKYLKSSSRVPRKVLDIGSGLGANVFPLLELNPSIEFTCIEKDPTIASDFKAAFDEKTQDGMVKPTVIVEDACTMPEFGDPESFDTVLLVDVIPYLNPNSVQATLKKIHAVLETGGLFCGSMFFSTPHIEEQEDGQLFMKVQKLAGAHYYPYSESFLYTMLASVGFRLRKAAWRLDFRFDSWMEFVAEKV